MRRLIINRLAFLRTRTRTRTRTMTRKKKKECRRRRFFLTIIYIILLLFPHAAISSATTARLISVILHCKMIEMSRWNASDQHVNWRFLQVEVTGRTIFKSRKPNPERSRRPFYQMPWKQTTCVFPYLQKRSAAPDFEVPWMKTKPWST